MMTRAKLESDLLKLGVRSGQTLMIHASLRAIRAPASEVIAALDSVVSPGGTLLMVLGAEDPYAFVNERPERERAELLADAEPFDPLTTPAEADVGYLAEAFRTTPATLVSDNPEGRFGARGAQAAEILRDAPWNDYYGPASPLEKLCAMSGCVLRLGADDDTTTLLHYAEYLVDLPNKRRVRRHRRVLENGKPVIRTVECLDDSNGIVKWNGPDYFGLIVRDYLATAPAPRGMVGHARSELLDARDLVAFAVRWMAQHLVRDRNP
jgi:aminoglycoside N3'-acetyltransferase